MCSDPYSQAQIAYRDALVHLSSTPHLLLRLYERYLFQLKQAQATLLLEPEACCQHLLQAQTVLQEILNLLRPEQVASNYPLHQKQLQKILQLQKHLSPVELSQLLQTGIELYDNWCYQIQLKRPKSYTPLNVRCLSDIDNIPHQNGKAPA